MRRATEASNRNPSRRLSNAAVAIVGVIVLGAAAFLYLEYLARQQKPAGPVLTAEAKAYVKHLKLSEVQMKATESYMKQTVVEIVGKISNQGDRALRSVSIQCVFYDPYGQVVLRERAEIVRSRLGGLKPGETKAFRLPFDSLPQSCNQGMPQLVIAQILFD